MRNSQRYALFVSIGALLLVLFQNCSQGYSVGTQALPSRTDSNDGTVNLPPSSQDPDVPSLVVQASPDVVVEGQQTTVTVTANLLDQISYQCVVSGSTQSVVSGTLSSSHQFQVPIRADVSCTVTGRPTVGAEDSIQAQVGVEVDCANRIKEGGSCRDFQCTSVLTLSSADLMSVPARTASGQCYAIKIMNAIANSSSTLTQTLDMEVISRDHNNGASNPNLTRHPYVLGHTQLQMQLLGPRVVKLAGGMSDQAPIRVDNFILMGVYPTSVNPLESLTSYYKVSGTSDSSIANAQGVNTGSIALLNQLLPISPFGPGGTSTIAPLEITSQVQPQVPYNLDLRALDCGGARELSNIYLLFQ